MRMRTRHVKIDDIIYFAAYYYANLCTSQTALLLLFLLPRSCNGKYSSLVEGGSTGMIKYRGPQTMCTRFCLYTYIMMHSLLFVYKIAGD